MKIFCVCFRFYWFDFLRYVTIKLISIGATFVADAPVDILSVGGQQLSARCSHNETLSPL